MKFLIQSHWPPYNLYQKFIWDTKNNENVILSFDHRLDKGVLIADIYICTTVYINLKNIPPREPRGIEIGPSYSAEGYNPPKKSQLGV